jgi:hypothetical protein
MPLSLLDVEAFLAALRRLRELARPQIDRCAVRALDPFGT